MLDIVKIRFKIPFYSRITAKNKAQLRDCFVMHLFLISNEYKDSNESTHSTASNSTVAFGDFNANDATSSFDRLKVIYKKVGNNESQAFGVWQLLSENERTAAFAHTQRLQGDLSLRSYLYVYLRDKEWMNGKNGADCYSKNGHAVTVLTRQSAGDVQQFT